VNIRASVQNSAGHHQVLLRTNAQTQTLNIPPKGVGYGSSVNGGELLFLALATCYCNDIYREAAARGISGMGMEVEVEGEFGAAGAPATNVTYRARVMAQASEEEIRNLLEHTDRVAEIQNTLRVAVPVTLSHVEAVPVGL
jgi:uncharacterized OsmC-like protein